MKKKVLFLIDSLGGGGAEKVLITLIRNLDRSKFDTTITTIVDTGAYRTMIPEGVKYKPVLKQPTNKIGKLIYNIKYKLIHNILPLKWVYNIFLPHNNDVEIAFVEGFSTKLLSYSSNKRARKIAWVHIDLINQHWISSVYRDVTAEKLSYGIFDYVIGVSNQVTSAVKELYSLEKAITLHNPIDSNEIIEKSKEKICGTEKRKNIRLVTLGRLEEQKGYDRLLRIMRKLIFEDKLNLELWILGDGSLRRELEVYTTENGLDSFVTFWGFKSNPYPYMAESDLFVCSSRAEGYSTAVTEAIILGLPIITTNCSGMKELLGKNNDYGIVTENDEKSLYLGLKVYLENTKKQIYYKQAVKQRSRDFAMKALMEPIEMILQK